MSLHRPYRLWALEKGAATLVGPYEDKGAARRVWSIYRTTVIALDGVVLEEKRGSDAAGVKKLRAAEESYHRDHPASTEPTRVRVSAETIEVSVETEEEPADADGYREGEELECAVKGCDHVARVPALDTAARTLMADFCNAHRTAARSKAYQHQAPVEVAVRVLREQGRISKALLDEAMGRTSTGPEEARCEHCGAREGSDLHDLGCERREAPSTLAEPEEPAKEASVVPVPVVEARQALAEAIEKMESTATPLKVTAVDHGDEVVIRIPRQPTAPSLADVIVEAHGYHRLQEAVSLVERGGGADTLKKILSLIESHGGFETVDRFLFNATMFAKGRAA